MIVLLVIPVMGWVLKEIRSIRLNNLKHLDVEFQRITGRLDRIDEKLDRHLEWHSERPDH